MEITTKLVEIDEVREELNFDRNISSIVLTLRNSDVICLINS
jgi:hypothetical protein